VIVLAVLFGTKFAFVGAACAALSLGSAAGAYAAAVRGTERGEVLIGTCYADSIRDKGGEDIVRSLSGNDKICGGYGRDRFYGGPATTTSTRRTGGLVLAGRTTPRLVGVGLPPQAQS
jgi:hypothetical protein